MALPDSELAKLLYRDNISLKHASRDRLNKELHDKMEASAPVYQAPALQNAPDQRGALSKALVQYLMKVGLGPWMQTHRPMIRNDIFELWTVKENYGNLTYGIVNKTFIYVYMYILNTIY